MNVERRSDARRTCARELTWHVKEVRTHVGFEQTFVVSSPCGVETFRTQVPSHPGTWWDGMELKDASNLPSPKSPVPANSDQRRKQNATVSQDPGTQQTQQQDRRSREVKRPLQHHSNRTGLLMFGLMGDCPQIYTVL